MTWIAPAEKDNRTVSLEKRLWDTTGQFRANPPFNVNAVDRVRLKDAVEPDRRFLFGLPYTDNADYLWIQLFYSALKNMEAGTFGGRAGFVMANSASDVRSSEQKNWQKLIGSRVLCVVIAGPCITETAANSLSAYARD